MCISNKIFYRISLAGFLAFVHDPLHDIRLHYNASVFVANAWSCYEISFDLLVNICEFLGFFQCKLPWFCSTFKFDLAFIDESRIKKCDWIPQIVTNQQWLRTGTGISLHKLLELLFAVNCWMDSKFPSMIVSSSVANNNALVFLAKLNPHLNFLAGYMN